MKTFDLRGNGDFSDPEFSLWAHRRTLRPGIRLSWRANGAGRDHGDEALYIEAGSVRCEGREVEAGGVVVIEGGAAAEIVTGAEGATIAHFGPRDPHQPRDGAYGPTAPGERGVHLVGPRGLLAIEEPGRSTRFFADSTCATCRITLFSTARSAEYRSAAHSHSEDELIYVLDGEITVHHQTLTPGMGVAIPGHETYGFRSGASGFRFLNYRRDVSTYRSAKDKTEFLEGPTGRTDITTVNDVR